MSKWKVDPSLSSPCFLTPGTRTQNVRNQQKPTNYTSTQWLLGVVYSPPRCGHTTTHDSPRPCINRIQKGKDYSCTQTHAWVLYKKSFGSSFLIYIFIFFFSPPRMMLPRRLMNFFVNNTRHQYIYFHNCSMCGRILLEGFKNVHTLLPTIFLKRIKGTLSIVILGKVTTTLAMVVVKNRFRFTSGGLAWVLHACKGSRLQFVKSLRGFIYCVRLHSSS